MGSRFIHIYIVKQTQYWNLIGATFMCVIFVRSPGSSKLRAKQHFVAIWNVTCCQLFATWLCFNSKENTNRNYDNRWRQVHISSFSEITSVQIVSTSLSTSFALGFFVQGSVGLVGTVVAKLHAWQCCFIVIVWEVLVKCAEANNSWTVQMHPSASLQLFIPWLCLNSKENTIKYHLVKRIR